MGKRTSYILILSLVVVTMAGIVIGIWSYISQDKLINKKIIVLNERSHAELEVVLSELCPGMSTSYEIHLKANKGDAFGITMNFEKTDTDSLAEFVDVEIRSNGEKLDSAKLSEYLGGKQVIFPARFDRNAEIEIEIVYSMGLEVGDEAQNATAEFNVILFAER